MLLPRFPMPPHDFWGTLAADDLKSFLLEIQQWRRAAVHYLKSGESHEGISSELIDLLLWALGDQQGMGWKVSPYALLPFPKDFMLEADKNVPQSKSMLKGGLVEILMWRAHLVDFLEDVWDTLGKPLFDLDECSFSMQLFIPPELEHVPSCPLCFQRLSESEQKTSPDSHYDHCPVQPWWGRHNWDEDTMKKLSFKDP